MQYWEEGATDDTKHLTVHVVFDIGTVLSNLQPKTPYSHFNNS